MKKCKITIIKRDLHKDLAEDYCKSKVELCQCFKDGDVFFAGFDQPEGFCGWAWNDIYKFVSALLSGGNYSTGVFKDWMKNENEMIACCTDAIRPVTFRIELIEENE